MMTSSGAPFTIWKSFKMKPEGSCAAFAAAAATSLCLVSDIVVEIVIALFFVFCETFFFAVLRCVLDRILHFRTTVSCFWHCSLSSFFRRRLFFSVCHARRSIISSLRNQNKVLNKSCRRSAIYLIVEPELYQMKPCRHCSRCVGPWKIHHGESAEIQITLY